MLKLGKIAIFHRTPKKICSIPTMLTHFTCCRREKKIALCTSLILCTNFSCRRELHGYRYRCEQKQQRCYLKTLIVLFRFQIMYLKPRDSSMRRNFVERISVQGIAVCTREEAITIHKSSRMKFPHGFTYQTHVYLLSEQNDLKQQNLDGDEYVLSV